MLTLEDAQKWAARLSREDLMMLLVLLDNRSEQEVAKIVVWLRAHECTFGTLENPIEPFDEAANAIEAGEYRNG